MNTFTSNQPEEYLGHSIIDTLSDDVLLCIFDSCRPQSCREFAFCNGPGTWLWYDLVHVCRRWRRLVFAFPGYLGLNIRCKSKADVQEVRDIWPALPLIIHPNFTPGNADEEDIIGALEHRDRMVGICFRSLNHSQLRKCNALMQEPFPLLTSLVLSADVKTMFHLGDAFLGGSAPLLREIRLCGIRFPSLPKLLSSTSNLATLSLWGIPMTGEGLISPDAMATCLSALTKLRSLAISFLRQTSFPYSTDQRSPSSAHAVLPALTSLRLEGPHGYLEDFVNRADAPLLKYGDFQFYDEPTFNTPRVPQFIHRTEMFKLLSGVEVYFRRESFRGIHACFLSSIGSARLALTFPCSGFPAQVATMGRICAQWPPFISHAEFLKLDDGYGEMNQWWEARTSWLGFLRPFIAVQTLHLCVVTSDSHVAHVLEGLEGETAAEVLPALRTIKLSGSEQGVSEILRLLGPFLVAREELGHPVVVVS